MDFILSKSWFVSEIRAFKEPQISLLFAVSIFPSNWCYGAVFVRYYSGVEKIGVGYCFFCPLSSSMNWGFRYI